MSLKRCEPPLVTLAILAFNQKEYILDAVRGALAQDYTPLEIIISDDCSTDGTFELIQSFVKSYAGPHKIIVNRSSVNKCILEHFFDIVDLASGSLLVLSAGDDISYPERVCETVNVWRKEKAVGLFANYDLIDHRGVLLKKDFLPIGDIVEEVDKVFPKSPAYQMHGASSAYDLEFVRKLPRPVGRFFFEDTYMTFMIKLHGQKVSKINKTLVAYRSHESSLSNSYLTHRSLSEIIEGQKKAEKYSLNKHLLYLFLYEYANHRSGLSLERKNEIDFYSLREYISKLEAKGSWSSLGFIGRIGKLLVHKRDVSFLRWQLPRLFGLRIFSIFKYLCKT